MTTGWLVYDESIPVDKDWVQEHVGNRVTIRLVLDLYEIIGTDGIEGMNDLIDKKTGVVLSDLNYAVGAWDVDDVPGPTSVLVEATGIVEDY